MELVYLWVDEYKNMRNKGLRFRLGLHVKNFFFVLFWIKMI
jgi:hypothetical protein